MRGFPDQVLIFLKSEVLLLNGRKDKVDCFDIRALASHWPQPTFPSPARGDSFEIPSPGAKGQEEDEVDDMAKALFQRV